MKKLKIVLSLSILISLLSGCGNPVPEDWQYTKEEAKDFTYVNSELLPVEDVEGIQLLRLYSAELLCREFEDDDLLIYDFDKLSKIDNGEDGYYTYENYRNTSVKIEGIDFDWDENTVDVFFDGEPDGMYGVIFNKSACADGGFLYSVPELNAIDNSKAKSLDQFEEDLLASPEPQKEDGYYDLVTHYGSLYLEMPKEGENFLSVTAMGIIIGVVTLVLGIGNFIWSIFQGNMANYHYFNELNNRLAIIDGKLNTLTNNLTNLFSTLLLKADMDEIKSYTENIAFFKRECVEPITNFTNKIMDDISDFLKSSSSNGSIDVEIKYKKNKRNEFVPISKLDPDDTTVEFSKNVKINFTQSKDYLSKYNRIDNHFRDLYYADIVKSIEKDVPTGFTKDKFATDIIGVLFENRIFTTFSNPDMFTAIGDFRDLVINYCVSLYKVDFLEIINKYISRCKLTCNFGFEARKYARSCCASLLTELERNAALAQLLCRISGGVVGEYTLVDEYLAARRAIIKAYGDVKKIPTNLCFRDGRVWEAKMLALQDKVKCFDYGTGKSTFSHSPNFQEVIMGPTGSYQKDYDKNAHNLADSLRLKAVSARYFAEKLSRGRETFYPSFIDYFRSIPGLINGDVNRLIASHVTEYSKPNVYRIFGDFSNRMATDADWGTDLVCDQKGLNYKKGQYFNINGYYKYKEGHDPACWRNGGFYTADIIDGTTGSFINKKDLIMYCDYLEDHSYWSKSGAENFAFCGVITYKHNGEWKTRFAFGLGIETTAPKQ